MVRTPESLKYPTLLEILCLMVLMGLFLFAMVGCASAYTEEELVTAIGHAENSKAHPYGIIPKYKHTTPRQACLNTVRHQKKLWDGKGDFIDFLAGKYAPLNVANDPSGLNVNWAKNVKWFLVKGER